MAHSFTSINLHVVFSTKERRKLLVEGIRGRVFGYMGGIVRNLGERAVVFNGMEDHVHGLVMMHSTMAVADLMRELKGDSTKWVRQELGREEFGWQTGYAAFSVSKSGMETVRTYIENQEEHHLGRTFEEEYLALLRKHEVEFDERFVFE